MSVGVNRSQEGGNREELAPGIPPPGVEQFCTPKLATGFKQLSWVMESGGWDLTNTCQGFHEIRQSHGRW